VQPVEESLAQGYILGFEMRELNLIGCYREYFLYCTWARLNVVQTREPLQTVEEELLITPCVLSRHYKHSPRLKLVFYFRTLPNVEPLVKMEAPDIKPSQYSTRPTKLRLGFQIC
jgi:hypothetical protein